MPRPLKSKSVEFRQVKALSYFGEIDSRAKEPTDDSRIGIEDSLDIEYDDREAFYDRIDVERLIYFLTFDEVVLLLFRYMGYKNREIIALLKLNSNDYYNLNNSLKESRSLFGILENENVQ